MVTKMNSASYHPAIHGAVRTAYALNERDLTYVLTVAAMVNESQAFLTAIKALPVSAAQVGADFVSKYLGDFTCARYTQESSRRHTLEFYNIEQHDIKVGHSITLTPMYVEINKYQNANGQQFVSPPTRIDLV